MWMPQFLVQGYQWGMNQAGLGDLSVGDLASEAAYAAFGPVMESTRDLVLFARHRDPNMLLGANVGRVLRAHARPLMQAASVRLQVNVESMLESWLAGRRK